MKRKIGSVLAVLILITLLLNLKKLGKIDTREVTPLTPPRETTAPPIEGEEEGGREIVSESVPAPERIKVPRLSLRGIIFRGGLLSRAMIKNLDTGEEGVYGIGEKIASFVIEDIKEDRLILRAGEKEIILRFSGLGGEPAVISSSPEVRAVGDSYIKKWRDLKVKTKEEVEREVSGYLTELARRFPKVYSTGEQLDFPNIRQVSDDTWEVGKEDAGKAIRNAGAIFNQVELVPHLSGERVEGFKVNFRPGQGSVWEKMGFQDKDIITQVNEVNINGIGRMIVAARSAQVKGRADVKLIRKGKILTRIYEVKD